MEHRTKKNIDNVNETVKSRERKRIAKQILETGHINKTVKCTRKD